MISVFSSPSRYTQGKHATRELGNEMKTLGLAGPALIIAGRSAVTLLSEVWKESLGSAGISHGVYPFGGECSLAEIERGKAAARKQGARVIVGAGGGKLLDAARAVAADLELPSEGSKPTASCKKAARPADLCTLPVPAARSRCLGTGHRISARNTWP